MSVIERDLIESREKERTSIGINDNPIEIPLLQILLLLFLTLSFRKDEGFTTFLADDWEKDKSFRLIMQSLNYFHCITKQVEKPL